MRKSIICLAASVLIISMGACSTKNCDEGGGKACEAASETKIAKSEVYTGVVPAADAMGIVYTLRLDYTTADNGEYDLVEAYLAGGDKSNASGITVKESYSSAGSFTVEKGSGENAGNTYIKLQNSAGAPICFIVNPDSTITMVNESLQPSENKDLDYTLTLAK